MKKTFFVLVLIAIIVVGIYAIKTNGKFKGWEATGDDIIGTISNLKTLPTQAVFASSTTTPPSTEGQMLDGGAEVNQDIITIGVDQVKLYVMAKGDTATSTAFIRQMVSFDDNVYFDLATSTSARTMATTTYDVAQSLMAIALTLALPPLQGYLLLIPKVIHLQGL